MKNTLIELDSLHRHGMEILRFLHMRGQSDDSKSDTGLDKKTSEFIGILRKINIAKLFEDKRIIAISGLQGQGKTTMLRNLYDYGETMDEHIFKGNQGRGEKFPILVTEKDTDTVTYQKHCYKFDKNTDSYSLTEEPEFIEYEEFKGTSINSFKRRKISEIQPTCVLLSQKTLLKCTLCRFRLYICGFLFLFPAFWHSYAVNWDFLRSR